MAKEFITNLLKIHQTSIVYKTVSKGQKSFRITQQLIQGIWNRSKKLKNAPVLILTIPANKKENFILRCHINKEKV